MPELASCITWFYYEDIAAAEMFYRETLGLALVEDQGWAKILEAGGSAFVGLVDGERGFCKPRGESAVLLTFVVEDVAGWYERLRQAGVPILRELAEHAEIQVRCFFIRDPGGYAVEIQQFLDPAVAKRFVR